MGIKVSNNAFATLAAGITSSGTSITLTTGQGARFPTLGAGDYFYATLIDTSNNLEIVKCTARSTDVLTVVRGQESTTARAYNTGDRIEIRITAQTFEDATGIEDGEVTAAKLASDAVTTAKIADANVTTAKIANANVTTAKIADANVTTDKIADANVTTAKINNNAVNIDKLANADILKFRSSYAQENGSNATTTGIDNLWGGSNAGIWSIGRSGYSSACMVFDTRSSAGTIQWAMTYGNDASYRRSRTDNANWGAWRQVD